MSVHHILVFDYTDLLDREKTPPFGYTMTSPDFLGVIIKYDPGNFDIKSYELQVRGPYKLIVNGAVNVDVQKQFHKFMESTKIYPTLLTTARITQFFQKFKTDGAEEVLKVVSYDGYSEKAPYEPLIALSNELINAHTNDIMNKIYRKNTSGGAKNMIKNMSKNKTTTKWTRTTRKVKVTEGRGKNANTVEKTVYKNSITGEQRVRKMVTRNGERKATYVKF